MLTEDLIDVPIEVFGGYCPAIVPANLPPGAANVAQDVMFPAAGVRTRGGLGAVAFAGSAIGAGAKINGLKTYLNASGQPRLMIWDSLGEMFKENPQGTLNLINSRPYTNLFYESQTLFSREYQAFFNSLGGFDIPRQYDDTNWDRVSQVGPGSGPTASNFQPLPASVTNPGVGGAVNLVASPGGIIWSDSEQVNPDPPPTTFIFNSATINTTAPHGFVKGNQVVIAGSASTPSVNSTWIVEQVLSATSFKIGASAAQSTAANGGNGTVQLSSGNTSITRSNNVATAITAAAHGFVVGWQVQISGIANTNLGGGIASISRDGNGVVTVTTTTAHGLPVNAKIVIAGVTNPDTSYNGTFSVASTPSATTLTYQQAGTVSASGAGTGNVQDPWNVTSTITAIPSATSFSYASIGANDSTTTAGTATIVGQISAGLHQVSVSFITRQGFITQPSPPVPFNATGGALASLKDLAIGPSNIVARLLLFTPVITAPATTGSFYSTTSTMLVNDNVTNAFVVDFSDAVLISSFQANYLFTQNELGESAFALGYNSRLAWTGERNKIQNLLNPTFDGGFATDAGGAKFPRGWTEDAANYAGGGQASAQGLPADYGDAYVITGNGATAVRGKITQSAYQDYLKVAIIAGNTSYTVRARIRSAGGLVAGTLHINLQSTQGAFTTVGLAVAAGQLGANYAEFTASLTDVPLVAPPSDLLLQVFADGTPTNNGKFLVDSIEICPTPSPFNYSIARFSHAFNPESYDSVTGQVQVRPGDGQQLRAGFPLRNSFYLAKDHYLGYVADDGVNEPSSWTFTEVSATVGICGPNAVDWNEEWAVFAERSGLYICWGSDPVKLTPEIQSDATFSGRTSWASINWTAAHTIWVRIDKANKMILVGAPINGATTPNAVFMMDYHWLDTAEEIASSPLVGYSTYTGKMLAHGRGRRWAIWNISANSMCFAERSDGTAQPFWGNGVGNAKVYQQKDSAIQASDDGVAINSQYQSYAAPSSMEEQQYQLRGHRKLFGYLKHRTLGVGNLSRAVTTAQRSTLLRTYTLSANPPGDAGIGVNLHGERFFVTFSTNAVGSWFQLEKIVLCVKKDSVALVTGLSS